MANAREPRVACPCVSEGIETNQKSTYPVRGALSLVPLILAFDALAILVPLRFVLVLDLVAAVGATVLNRPSMHPQTRKSLLQRTSALIVVLAVLAIRSEFIPAPRGHILCFESVVSFAEVERACVGNPRAECLQQTLGLGCLEGNFPQTHPSIAKHTSSSRPLRRSGSIAPGSQACSDRKREMNWCLIRERKIVIARSCVVGITVR
jgi:hypothetical protein